MNYQIVDALNDMSGHVRFLDDVMIFAARDLIFVAFAVFALAMWPVVRQHAWVSLAKVVATLGLAFVFGLIAAELYAEQRPFTTHHDIRLLVAHAPGQSFPSDHATAAFAMALAVLVFVSRSWGKVLMVMAVVIGVARVYTGVHYPSDILGSLAVAGLAVAVVVLASATASRDASPGPRPGHRGRPDGAERSAFDPASGSRRAGRSGAGDVRLGGAGRARTPARRSATSPRRRWTRSPRAGRR